MRSQRTSDELLQVETGSLYPALHRLEAKGWIEASWELSDWGKRARVLQADAPGAEAAFERTVEVGRLRARNGIDLNANERP